MRLFSAPKSLEQANFYHLVLDIAWFGLALPATTRFLSVYAIRLGADADELGLLTSLPAIILLASASLGSRWLSRYDNATHGLFWPALGMRLAFLLPALTPFMPADFQAIWLILSLTLPALPQGIATIAFLVMMREAVQEQQVTPLLSRRSVALNVAVGLSGLALGLWLEEAPFPINYQSMFVLAFALAMMSLWHLMKIHLLPIAAPQPKIQPSRVNPWRSPQFQQVAFITAIAHVAFFSVFPLTPLHLMNTLKASEGFMGIYALAELAAGAGIALITSRIAARIGSRPMIAVSMGATALAAMIIALAPNLTLTLPAAALTGAGWTMAGIGMFAFFTENTSSEGKAAYTTAYMQVIFLSMFVGPMIGSGLNHAGISLVVIILIGAALRLIAAILTQFNTLKWMERTFRVALTSLTR